MSLEFFQRNGVTYEWWKYNSSASNYPDKSVGLNPGQDSAQNNEARNLNDWYDNIITFYILEL